MTTALFPPAASVKCVSSFWFPCTAIFFCHIFGTTPALCCSPPSCLFFRLCSRRSSEWMRTDLFSQPFLLQGHFRLCCLILTWKYSSDSTVQWNAIINHPHHAFSRFFLETFQEGGQFLAFLVLSIFQPWPRYRNWRWNFSKRINKVNVKFVVATAGGQIKKKNLMITYNLLQL